MALPVNRTLESLRLELSGRLGFAATGVGSGANLTVLNSFLRNAQWQLYWAFDWKQLKKAFDLNSTSTPMLGINQQFIDYPDDCNPDRILSMASSGAVTLSQPSLDPMREGIELQQRNSNITDRPRYYELRDQIEIWPKTHVAGYAIRMEYVKRLTRFNVDGDKTSLPAEKDDLILLHALANAKGHYRQSDAQAYAGQLNTALGRVRMKEAPANKSYVRGITNRSDPYESLPVAAGGISTIT